MCSQFFGDFCRVQVFAEIPITSIHAIWAKAAGNQLTEIHWMVEALRRHCLRSILRYQNMWISGIWIRKNAGLTRKNGGSTGKKMLD